MPKGVYKRTEKHRKICSNAGKASAKSPINIARYAARNAEVTCPCGNKFMYPVSQKRQYCNKFCKDRFSRIQNIEAMSYGTIHTRVREAFGTPSLCENCGTTKSKKFEWANLNHTYKLIRSEWRRLCCQCHRRFDRGTKNKIEVV